MSVASRTVSAPLEKAEHAASFSLKLLLCLFLLSLPMVNPWVRGDGVGYYAYVRSLLINHDLRFEDEWKSGNPSFVMNRVDESGHLRADQYTRTGYVANHFSVGPSILWSPFLVAVHWVVLGLNHFGAHIVANGYSRPYVIAMALATALYGFLGLWLSFDLARKYFEERWALLATLGIWFASSLPVYMYFNPSWSHAHSAFAVALFLWYWHRTRGARTSKQWLTLGLMSGLMLDVYYPNALFLLVPFAEALQDYRRALLDRKSGAAVRQLLLQHAAYAVAVIFAFLPTLITRWIVYGHPLQFGVYSTMHWHWTLPMLLQVLFSSDHGLLVWTPILIPAIAGLWFLRRQDPDIAWKLSLAALAFYLVIAFYPNWDGLSSFGNRFFVSLTPLFVLGLAASLQRFGALFARSRTAVSAAGLIIGLLMLWNGGFIFQWGTHLIPARGPISWQEMARNQVTVVPVRLTNTLGTYLLRRKTLMERIEKEDIEQMRSRQRQESRSQ